MQACYNQFHQAGVDLDNNHHVLPSSSLGTAGNNHSRDNVIPYRPLSSTLCPASTIIPLGTAIHPQHTHMPVVAVQNPSDLAVGSVSRLAPHRLSPVRRHHEHPPTVIVPLLPLPRTPRVSNPCRQLPRLAASPPSAPPPPPSATRQCQASPPC